MIRLLFSIGLSSILFASPLLEAKKKLKHKKKHDVVKHDEAATREDAQEFIRILGIKERSRESTLQSTPVLIEMYASKFSQLTENFDTEAFKVFMQKSVDRMVADLDELDEVLITLLRKYYSREDIKNIIAYYQSPTGQKVLRVGPQAIAEASVIIQEWQTNKMLDIVSTDEKFSKYFKGDQSEVK